MAKKKRESETVVGAPAPSMLPIEELEKMGAEIGRRQTEREANGGFVDGSDDNDLDASGEPDVRGVEMSKEEHATDPVDRMRAARDARKTNGTATPRNPPQYLVLGQRREDGEYDVLAVRKSRRGAVKFATETRGLIRRSYLGVTVMRSKIVHMEGF